MLVLLPPSEGKASPKRGKPVDLAALSSPDLTAARTAVVDALVALCSGPADRACAVLALSPGQAGDLARNRGLLQAPTVPAAQLYTGVLFDALGLATLPPEARRRANRRVLVSSGLWGMVRLTDRLPWYRLSGAVSLPPLGPLARFWREQEAFGRVVPEAAGARPILDLRSGTYAAAWRPPAAHAGATVTVTVRQGGKVVSHHNKATKGRVARAVLAAPAEPRSPADLADLLKDAGFPVALAAPASRTRPWELTVDE